MLFDESREAQQLERSANGCFVDRLPGGLPGGAENIHEYVLLRATGPELKVSLSGRGGGSASR